LHQLIVVLEQGLVITIGRSTEAPLRNVVPVNDLNVLVQIALLIIELYHASMHVFLHLSPHSLFNLPFDALSVPLLRKFITLLAVSLDGLDLG
jgi:hypothetical protein